MQFSEKPNKPVQLRLISNAETGLKICPKRFMSIDAVPVRRIYHYENTISAKMGANII